MIDGVSHVERGIQFLWQFQDLHLESILDVHQHRLVSAALLVLLLISTDEVYRQSLSPKTACPAHPVQVGISLCGEVCIDGVIP